MRPNYAHQIVEATAGKFPDHIAVHEEDRTITYAQLNDRAEKLSHLFKEIGVCRQSIIGIYLDAGIDYIVALLGALKAGACFMPLGSGFAEGFISTILKKTDPAVIVTRDLLVDQLTNSLSATGNPPGYCNVVTIADTAERIHLEPLGRGSPAACGDHRHKNVADITDDDGCYIIITSGSTGAPKPIWGSHKGLCHFVQWEINEFGIDHTVRGSLFSPVSFDVSLRDIFVPLVSGGTVCIPNHETKLDPGQLARWLREQRISLVHIVPTLFRLLTREISATKSHDDPFPGLRWVLIAGEPLFGIDLQDWRNAAVSNQAELVNLYGPSETTLAKLFYRIGKQVFQPDQIVPIGVPLPDTDVLITENNKLCSAGETGEIHIKTSYASKGYYNDPERNRKHFVQIPSVNDGNQVIYRTGDYGRFLENGVVAYVGRKDKQIKLQGKRIDLNQIEIHLRSHPLIRECAVTTRLDSNGYQRLIAYHVLDSEKIPTVEGIKRHLKGNLPDYMIPSIFVAINEMPLTHSGKIDRNALPDPKHERPTLEQTFISPENDLQKKLCRIWCDILDIDKVGIHDNFFDIGGTSMLSMVVSQRIKDILGIDVPVVKLFEFPQIHSLARYLGNGQTDRPAFIKIQTLAGRRRSHNHRNRRNITA